jgi:hypothetical protein
MKRIENRGPTVAALPSSPGYDVTSRRGKRERGRGGIKATAKTDHYPFEFFPKTAFAACHCGRVSANSGS